MPRQLGDQAAPRPARVLMVGSHNLGSFDGLKFQSAPATSRTRIYSALEPVRRVHAVRVRVTEIGR